MDTEISDKEHRRQCKLAGCGHPPVYPGIGQGWCARCRAVAFGGVYEGIAFIDGKIVSIGKLAKS